MSIPIDKVLSMLRTFEHGATTKQLAAKLGMRPDSLGGRLSKSFLWGKGVLNRELRRNISQSGVGYDFYIWRVA